MFGQEHVDRYRESDGEEGHHWQAPYDEFQPKADREIPMVVLEPG